MVPEGWAWRWVKEPFTSVPSQSGICRRDSDEGRGQTGSWARVWGPLEPSGPVWGTFQPQRGRRGRRPSSLKS